MIEIKEADQDELNAFREYWQEVVKSGKLPIAGDNIKTIKLGAENNTEPYRNFSKYMDGLIAIDFGVAPHNIALDTLLG